MDTSTVPLRDTDFHGNVKLPRRFAVPGSCDDSVDRLEDLARAMTWVRQELVSYALWMNESLTESFV